MSARFRRHQSGWEAKGSTWGGTIGDTGGRIWEMKERRNYTSGNREGDDGKGTKGNTGGDVWGETKEKTDEVCLWNNCNPWRNPWWRRYSPWGGTSVCGGLTLKQMKKSKKPGEAKRRNHCVLIPVFCTTHCSTKGTMYMYNAVAKAKGLETWKGKGEVFRVKLRQSKREERYFWVFWLFVLLVSQYLNL